MLGKLGGPRSGRAWIKPRRGFRQARDKFDQALEGPATRVSNWEIIMNNNKNQLLLELDPETEVEENPEIETQEDSETTPVLYNSEFELDKKSKIQGSPVFSELEIPFNSYRVFETVCSWSKARIVKENLVNPGFVNPSIFREWAQQFLIHPLLEPEYSTWIMTAEGESLLTILGQLDDQKLASFSDFYSRFVDTNSAKDSWESELMSIGIDLMTRLGIIRLGKSRLQYAPRIWVGRQSEALSPQIKFEAFGNDIAQVASGFIRKFIGEDAINLDWELGYRGGLWRTIVRRPQGQVVTYVEEFEEDNY